MNPLVSIIIPSFSYRASLETAIRSVLSQTYTNIEVIIVSASNNSYAYELVESLEDNRVKIVSLPIKVAGGDARNAGIAASSGSIIGLLDDDDEWFSTKIEKQIALLDRQGSETLVVCKVAARSPNGTFIWPRRWPNKDEKICDYLFCRRELFAGEAVLQTSTFFGSKDLFLQTPFRPGLECHQDWDLAIRMIDLAGVTLATIDEPLVVWNIDQSQHTLSKAIKAVDSRQWIEDLRPVISKEAFFSFICIEITTKTSWSATATLLLGAIKLEGFTLLPFFIGLTRLVIPMKLRRRVRGLFHGQNGDLE